MNIVYHNHMFCYMQEHNIRGASDLLLKEMIVDNGQLKYNYLRFL